LHSSAIMHSIVRPISQKIGRLHRQKRVQSSRALLYALHEHNIAPSDRSLFKLTRDAPIARTLSDEIEARGYRRGRSANASLRKRFTRELRFAVSAACSSNDTGNTLVVTRD